MARLPPVYCPQCQKKYRLPKSFENRQVVCKRCQRQFLVSSGVDDSSTLSGGNLSSPFDSLDVDELLNASTSGLEKSKLSAKRRPKKTRRKVAEPKLPNPTQAQTHTKNTKQEHKVDSEEVVETNDRDPDLVE